MPPRSDPEQQVVVTGPEPDDAQQRRRAPERTTSRDLLEAIRSIPDQVAAKVGAGDGEAAPGTGGRREVTFEPEPAPEPEAEPDADAGGDGAPSEGPPSPPVSQNKPRFRHPSRPRRRVDIGV
jgi:hypothetical protein